jgi:hypothetical protein
VERKTSREPWRPWWGLAVAGALGALLSSPLAAQRATELPDRDRRLEPELQDIYQVGSFDAEDWELFGEVSQVGFDAAGNLYVLDRQNHRVVVVDPRGGFLRQFGKEGEGPGEWRMTGGMGVLADGTVVISDGGHRAYMVYGPDGAYRHAVSMGDGGTISLGRLQADLRGGAVFNAAGAGFTMRMSVGGGLPDEPQGRPIERVTLGPEGAISTFYSAWQAPPPPASQAGAGATVRGGQGPIRMAPGPPIFEPQLRVAALPDGGLAVVDSSAYAVKLIGPDGRERGRLTRRIAPVPVTRRIEEAEKARQLAQLEAGEGPQMRVMMRGADGGTQALDQERIREMQRQQLEGRGFYPEIPVVAALAASPRGTLWLERATVDPDEPGAIDLFRVDGDYLGTVPSSGVRIPAAFGPDGLVAYIVRDEFDVPTIEVKRLPAEVR